MQRLKRVLSLTTFALCLATAFPSVAQIQDTAPVPGHPTQCTEQELRDVLRDAWRHSTASGLPVGSPEAKKAAYTRILKRVSTRVAAQADCLRTFLDEKLAETGDAVARHQSTLARSLEASASNPASVRAVEPSGLVDAVALALGSQNFVAADQSAVTLNLGAAALFSQARSQASTPAGKYRDAGWLNHLGGTFTFGAKLPAKEITGFSGLPDADDLFDVIAWDVKVRLFGDRDPRGTRWDRLNLDRLGPAGWSDAMLLALVPDHPDDALVAALQERGVQRVEDARREIGQSLQVSLKVAGRHQTNEKGKDKFSAVLLLDKGLGDSNLTLNATYSIVDQVTTAPTAPTFRLKTWSVAASVGGTVLQDVLVTGRGAEWTLSANGDFPVDDASVPLTRKRTWKAQLALSFPVSKSAQVPLSVTFTNDPNSLTKQKFVRGLVGINYDFGALSRLGKKPGS